MNDEGMVLKWMTWGGKSAKTASGWDEERGLVTGLKCITWGDNSVKTASDKDEVKLSVAELQLE